MYFVKIQPVHHATALKDLRGQYTRCYLLVEELMFLWFKHCHAGGHRDAIDRSPTFLLDTKAPVMATPIF